MFVIVYNFQLSVNSVICLFAPFVMESSIIDFAREKF